MFSNRKLVKGLVAKVRKAERETLGLMSSKLVEQEPSITDRLLGIMGHVLNGEKIGGVVWTAKTLTDKGRGSQESEFGADFMSVFHVDIPGFSVTKGFLAQAKLIEPGQAVYSADAVRMKKQCEKMLSYSPASYLFIYSQQSGILVAPAIDVLAARDCNPHELSTKPLGKFYEDHFECFIGDHAIKTASPAGLRDLAEAYDARKIFLLAGGKWERNNENFS